MGRSLALGLPAHGGMNVATLAVVAVLIAAPVADQVVPAPEKNDGRAVQHGARPNPDEVRAPAIATAMPPRRRPAIC